MAFIGAWGLGYGGWYQALLHTMISLGATNSLCWGLLKARKSIFKTKIDDPTLPFISTTRSFPVFLEYQNHLE